MDIRKGIRVESVKEDAANIMVTTTGARYAFNKSEREGKIFCYQMLNQERLIATIEFNHPFSDLTVQREDESKCVLHQRIEQSCSHLRFQINSDSLLDLYCMGELKGDVRMVFHGNFTPRYCARKEGNVLLIDETGGIGFYPYKGLKSATIPDFTCKEWEAGYTLSAFGRFLISVFPPRRFNYSQSLDERIVHHGIPDAPEIVKGEVALPSPFPSDDEIKESGKYANVLVLHERIWQGKYAREGKPIKTYEDILKDASLCCFDYIPRDEKELRRVIKQAHSMGMKVIPYMSPFYSTAKGKDFVERVGDAQDRYGFDGVYLDGISADILYSYQMIRDLRELLKGKIIYCHCTNDPLMSSNIYCPFIDTYADYILRAENIGSFDDKYLRYVISGYNISNSIGYICYSVYSMDFIREIIPRALAVNARFYLGSPETKREKVLKEEYFPKFEELSSQLKTKTDRHPD